ncbi:hypothetical protein HZC34_01880 [Candidatus Saganbacteria bacterium]|nr:hypothetical protein [Candidatus Saganbacteria bacterium]
MVEQINGKLPDNIKKRAMRDLNDLLASKGASPINFENADSNASGASVQATPIIDYSLANQKGVIV